jgi:hypothetical protein
MNPKTKKPKLYTTMASIRNSCSNSRSNNNSSYSSSGIHNESAPECSCHVRAVIRTVRKDGPNKGKKFWGCRNYVVSFNVSVEFSLFYVMDIDI